MGSASPDRTSRGRAPSRALASLQRARYRAWQFFRALNSSVSPEEAAEVRALLSPAELALFVRMEPADRRHSLDLVHELRRDAARTGREVPRELIVAALVHDTGKGRLRLWHRVAFVLLDAFAPRLARHIEAEHGAPWRRALWRLRHHADLSARLLRDAGTDPRVVELVAGHTSPPPAGDADAAWFNAADDRV